MSGREEANRRRARGDFTFTEAARREQIIGLTIELIAEHGYAGATLARIAEAAGLSNAAVLYFFGNKREVIRAASQEVFTGVIQAVSTAIAGAPSARDAVDAYVRALVGHLAANPSHTRVVMQMVTAAPPGLLEQVAGGPATGRWRPVADLIEQAQRDGVIRELDARTAAIALTGSVDAIFGEWLTDPTYDLDAAVDELLELFDRSVSRSRAAP